MDSDEVPRIPWPTVWLVGKHPVRSRKLMELGHLCQAIRDTLKQLEMAGDAWPERVGHAECRKQEQQEHVLCTKLQDPEVEHIIENCPGNEIQVRERC